MANKEFRIGDIAKLKYGKMLSKEYFKEDGYSVYSGYGITGYTDKYLYKDPMLIVVARGVGGTGDVKISPSKSWVTNLSIVLDVDDRIVDKRYLKHLLSLDSLKDKLNTGSAQAQITISSLEPYKVSLPGLKYQRKVSDTIELFDELIENNTRRIAILEEMARLIYREWFVHYLYPGHENDRLVDSGTELGDVPEGWGIRKLKNFGRIETGKTPRKKDPENYGDYMPFIKTPDMHDQFFVIKTSDNLSEIGANSQKKKTLPPNSICVSCIGTAGVIAITSVPSQTNQQINSIIIDKDSYREFLYYVIKDLRPLMEKIGSTGATMTNISKGKFQALQVLWPGDILVGTYHEKVAPIFDQIQVLQKQSLKLKKSRELLLPKLISGKVEV